MFNGKELQNELGLNWYDYGARNYDPALGRWMNIDPLAEKYYKTSPYVYCLNNPVYYVDPYGMDVTFTGKQAQEFAAEVQSRMNTADAGGGGFTIDAETGDMVSEGWLPGDVIHTDQFGYLTAVDKATGPHKVVDENGKELKVNDPKFDQEVLSGFIDAYNFTGGGEAGIRMFTVFTNKRMANLFNELDLGNIANKFKNLMISPYTRGLAIGYLGLLGHSAFDFADEISYASFKAGIANQGTGSYPADGTGGFIRFQGSSTLYNIYDAGNFLTGKALNMIGVNKKAILTGANWNSIGTRNGPDSAADQKALNDGINYTGIRWSHP